MGDLAARAERLLALHHTGDMLVLPTVWDAWSARVSVEAGFPALSIGSDPLAEARGRSDNEGMTLDDALDGIARICAAVDVPVTADVESGYGAPAAELVERVLAAGAVGINVEDTVHGEGGRSRSLEEHATYVAELRRAADVAGVDLVINARTDVFLHGDRFADPLAEAVARLQASLQAGARCVYPIAVPDAATLRSLLERVDGPLNVLADPEAGAPAGSMAQLREMGVARVTFGPYLQRRLAAALHDLVTPWR